jgi:hypothetical protein
MTRLKICDEPKQKRDDQNRMMLSRRMGMRMKIRMKKRMRMRVRMITGAGTE